MELEFRGGGKRKRKPGKHLKDDLLEGLEVTETKNKKEELRYEVFHKRRLIGLTY